MTLTPELPTKAGWYWLEYKPGTCTEIVQIIDDDYQTLMVAGRWCSPQDIRQGFPQARWAGPILPPSNSSMTTKAKPIVQLKIYGANDDLIEIEGGITAEFDDLPTFSTLLAFSEGTVLRLEFMSGIWRIDRLNEGTATFQKTEGTNNDDDPSDVVTLKGEIEWVVKGDVIANA